MKYTLIDILRWLYISEPFWCHLIKCTCPLKCITRIKNHYRVGYYRSPLLGATVLIFWNRNRLRLRFITYVLVMVWFLWSCDHGFHENIQDTTFGNFMVARSDESGELFINCCVSAIFFIERAWSIGENRFIDFFFEDTWNIFKRRLPFPWSIREVLWRLVLFWSIFMNWIYSFITLYIHAVRIMWDNERQSHLKSHYRKHRALSYLPRYKTDASAL